MRLRWQSACMLYQRQAQETKRVVFILLKLFQSFVDPPLLETHKAEQMMRAAFVRVELEGFFCCRFSLVKEAGGIAPASKGSVERYGQGVERCRPSQEC